MTAMQNLGYRNNEETTVITKRTLLVFLLSLTLHVPQLRAQDDAPKASQTLIQNVRIFDGLNDRLTPGHVLIENNLIKSIGDIKSVPEGTKVIDGGGMTLMPGIIEAHGHIGLPIHLSRLGGAEDWQYIAAKTTAVAKFYLDHGWTTVRDVGGPTFGIKKAIDEGVVPGPRIYPSGMFISQTSGHGDFRQYAERHPMQLSELPFFNKHFGHVADGVPEVLRATREELRKGAVHIKMMAGGGISSQYDPLHTAQYTLEEMQAAVKAASDWDTYVMVHAYTDESVARAVKAGVKVIEHGQLITEKTAQLMAEEDVWLSIQVAYVATPPTKEAIKQFGQTSYLKWKGVNDGLSRSINLARQYELKIAFGTDLWGDEYKRVNEEFTTRMKYFTAFEVLRQATTINGELLRLTGKLNPYPDGPIGIIKEGAYADILLVNGNPLEDISVLTKAENLHVIMKDGKIYKNTLK